METKLQLSMVPCVKSGILPRSSCYIPLIYQVFAMNDGLNIKASPITSTSKLRYWMLGLHLEALFFEGCGNSNKCGSTRGSRSLVGVEVGGSGERILGTILNCLLPVLLLTSSLNTKWTILFCHKCLLLWCPVQAQQAKWPWTKTFEIISQNGSLLPKVVFVRFLVIAM